MRRHDFYRKGNSSNVIDVTEFIETELDGSDFEIGYRQMHERCIQGGLRVTGRKTVATIIKKFDPEWVELRRRKYLRGGCILQEDRIEFHILMDMIN